MLKKDYKVCVKCIMDTSDPEIIFDDSGICNHCYRYDKMVSTRTFSEVERPLELEKLVNSIKENGKGKPYDCIIGVSGGVDSTYVAYIVKQFGLRPLAVHFDNGWNSELSVMNIENIIKKLDIDLHTHVVDWEEFKDIQLSFLKASTPDAEIPTDHAINAILFKLADQYKIKHILNGVNIATEAFLPLKWGYGYYDFRYIKNVQNLFGKKKIKTMPHFNLVTLFYYLFIKKLKMVPILNYIHYDKASAMAIIEKELDWRYYGGKHYESIYTRFFQGYILPRKFNIDKRRAHLSNQICSMQVTREFAEEAIKNPTYAPELQAEDREYAIKKFDITDKQFEDIMQAPVKTFLDYKTYYDVFEFAKKVKNKLNFNLGA